MIYKLSDKNGNYTGVRRIRLADIGWKEKDLENLIANILLKKGGVLA